MDLQANLRRWTESVSFGTDVPCDSRFYRKGCQSLGVIERFPPEVHADTCTRSQLLI